MLKATIALMSLFPFCLFSDTASDKEASRNIEEAFTRVYKEALWGRHTSGQGSSGLGSDVEFVKQYMFYLQNFLRQHNIKSVVDVGCGDWEFSQHIDWSGITYTGVDVVKQVIEQNKQKFSSPTISFITADFIRQDLPQADLLICKDVLKHLPNKDIFAFTKQLSKFKYCLIINDVHATTLSSQNEDQLQPGGMCRTLDITRFPFNIAGKKVLTFMGDSNIDNMKQVVLIEKK